MLHDDLAHAVSHSRGSRIWKNLAIVLGASLPFVLWRVCLAWPLRPLLVLPKILGPTATVATVVLLAPILWRLYDRGRLNWPMWKVALAALVLVSAAVSLINGLDWSLYALAGQRNAFLRPFLNELTFYAPAFVLIGRLISKYHFLEGENLQIRDQVRLAQSRALRSQLQPHTLFNSLSGLAELIHKDPCAAEASVRHLSDFLRKVLHTTEMDSYSLSEERILLVDYLDMEALRLGSRLQVNWDWDEGLDAIRIPPLLLQPLVENAIKYGIAPNPEGGTLTLSAHREGEDLRLEIRNDGLPFKLGPVRGTGIGIRNLRTRLHLAYGSRARLSVGTDGPCTLALIQISPKGSTKTADAPGARPSVESADRSAVERGDPDAGPAMV